VGNFLTKSQEGSSLADSTHYEPSLQQIHSRFFSLGQPTKKGHYKESHRGYISTIGEEFPLNQFN